MKSKLLPKVISWSE